MDSSGSSNSDIIPLYNFVYYLNFSEMIFINCRFFSYAFSNL